MSSHRTVLADYQPDSLAIVEQFIDTCASVAIEQQGPGRSGISLEIARIQN